MFGDSPFGASPPFPRVRTPITNICFGSPTLHCSALPTRSLTPSSGGFEQPPTRDVRSSEDLSPQSARTSTNVRVASTQALEFGNEILTVLVGRGDSRESFAVHMAVIQKRVPDFFDRAKEEMHDTLALPGVKPEVFNLYLHHLYTEQVPSKPDVSNPSVQDVAMEITLLCRFFALAGIMRDELAVKDAISAIYTTCHEQPPESPPLLPSSTDVAIIYDATYGACGAMRLMVDLYVWKATREWVEDSVSSGLGFPAEFLADLTIALLDQRKGRRIQTSIGERVDYYY